MAGRLKFQLVRTVWHRGQGTAEIRWAACGGTPRFEAHASILAALVAESSPRFYALASGGAEEIH